MGKTNIKKKEIFGVIISEFPCQRYFLDFIQLPKYGEKKNNAIY